MTFILQIFMAMGLVSLPALITANPSSGNTSSSCHCIPGDACWPTDLHWTALNETINGRLIKTVPLGSVCHNPTYDARACAALQAVWAVESTHYSVPASLMEPFFQNGSCTPFTPVSQPCELGFYADYSINVSTAADIISGLAFAKETNVRITIKNTGHDYLGRSSGQGSLSLWTHNLKDIDFLNYTSTNYTGPAVKLGAGVQAFEVYDAAFAEGLRVVGGKCPTVGLAGGYTQGGGHSALSSIHGLSADQTLEWEVISADGSLITASPSENVELYWALSGGGPGNYGVVLSLTVKAYAEGPVEGAEITFSPLTSDTWTAAFERLTERLPELVDAGSMPLYLVTSAFFQVVVTYPDTNGIPMISVLEPFLDDLTALGIVYTMNTTNSSTYYEHYWTYFGPYPEGYLPPGQPTGGRLLPRSLVEDETAISGYTAAIQEVLADGDIYLYGVGLNVNHTVAQNTPSSNAVLPAWRTTVSHLIIVGSTAYNAKIEDQRAAQEKITDVYLPLLVTAIPDGGAYMNEADFQEQNWKVDFYGENYDALKAVKDVWDPTGLFYVRTGVGSDEWIVDDEGRLCRSSWIYSA